MQSGFFIIQNKVGLHARPAALFVQTAAKFKAQIMIRNCTKSTPFVDAKSILRVLGLGVSQNHEIEVTADGQDEQKAMEALTRLIETDFADAQEAKS